VRTTVSIDDALYDRAVELLDPEIDKKEIFRETFRTFIRVQAAKRLAEMGGKLKEIQSVPRRRADEALG